MNAEHHTIHPEKIQHCLDAICSCNQDTTRVPFPYSLSLKPLIQHWREQDWYEDHPFWNEAGRKLKEQVEAQPDLDSESLSMEQFERHRDLALALFSILLPTATWEEDLFAVYAPFSFDAFIASREYRRWVPNDQDIPKANLDDQTYGYLRILYGYAAILEKFYDIHWELGYPVIRTAKDPDTGMDFHFQVDINARFADVRALKPPPKLSDADRKRLMAHLTDINVLTTLIPPDHFLFYGFYIAKIEDVTDSEVLSSMKRLLMDRMALMEPDRFKVLQDKMRILFRRLQLNVSLVLLYDDQVWILQPDAAPAPVCTFQNSKTSPRCQLDKTLIGKSIQEGRPLVIEDLQALESVCEFDKQFCKQGYVNFVAAPLFYEKEPIGVLVLTAPCSGDLNAVNSMKLREITPLFAGALKRSIGEIGNQIEAVIKKQCTAIHPSVEWRFRGAAIEVLRHTQTDTPSEMAPIVFNEVYPLFGISDIRDSSQHRNTAIQEDMRTHLRLVRDVLNDAWKSKPMSILNELIHRLDLLDEHIGDGLTAEGEFKALDFIHHDIHPILGEMAEFSRPLRDRIEAYHGRLSAEHQTIYEKRRDYDESVSQLNRCIHQILDQEQAAAQQVYPHYFEKHSSDGVDHTIYIGRSLNPNNRFDPIYLRNLRLWQLMVMSAIARQCATLRQDFPMPLETAHLIAVQTAPLNIRFRYDEKKFDVDGAYDVRYEILKKRIDKARIKGHEERVTQPGKIAIVFSHGREGTEYRRYLDYLTHTGHAAGEVEELELEDLQGIQGLRALRFTVPETGSAEGMDFAAIQRHAEQVVSLSG